MFKILKRASLVAALAVGSMTLSTTAEARDRYRDRGGDDAAIAIGAGVIGLALGAAIASDRGRDRYYYDDYYYGRPRGGYYYRSYPRYRGYDRRDYPRYRGYDRRDYRRWDGRRYGGWRY